MKQDITNPLPAKSLESKTVYFPPGFTTPVISTHVLSHLSIETSQENSQFFQIPW